METRDQRPETRDQRPETIFFRLTFNQAFTCCFIPSTIVIFSSSLFIFGTTLVRNLLELGFLNVNLPSESLALFIHFWFANEMSFSFNLTPESSMVKTKPNEF